MPSLALTAVGAGGALTLVTRERSSEFAVRVALGARPRQVWWNVQRDGLVLAAIGGVLGTAGALFGARAYESVVYGVRLRDPISHIMAPVILGIAAFAAVAIPATRATRTSPVTVLRDS